MLLEGDKGGYHKENEKEEKADRKEWATHQLVAWALPIIQASTDFSLMEMWLLTGGGGDAIPHIMTDMHTNLRTQFHLSWFLMPMIFSVYYYFNGSCKLYKGTWKSKALVSYLLSKCMAEIVPKAEKNRGSLWYYAERSSNKLNWNHLVQHPVSTVIDYMKSTRRTEDK